MTVVINPNSYSRHMSCHCYEGVMSVLCTPLQVKCYQSINTGICFENYYRTTLGQLWEMDASCSQTSRPQKQWKVLQQKTETSAKTKKECRS